MDHYANFFSAFCNAQAAKKKFMTVSLSKKKYALVCLFASEGLINGFLVHENSIILSLKYKLDGLHPVPMIQKIARISLQGRRVYYKADQLTTNGALNQMNSLFIISTNKGLMTHHQAKHHHLGGEVFCQIFS